MPVTAWIDERHLPPLGLTNAWGYNPVTFMALDPRLAPGGLAELRDTVAALREAGIGVDPRPRLQPYRRERRVRPDAVAARARRRTPTTGTATDGSLVNDTGTGNTIDCSQPVVQALVLDSLRHFVPHAGVDGFRFDLAPILGRNADGFDAGAPLLAAIGADPVLADRVMIAEPWDIGPDGYQLGNFPEPFPRMERPLPRRRQALLARRRQHARRAGDAACRLVGHLRPQRRRPTRSVNFIAAHDGMTLADVAAYEHKHNEANGENNRDGHNENFSWNNGVEGETADAEVIAAQDARHPRAAGHALPVARHDHADRRRRVRPHAARQQQRLCAGQCADLARLGRPRRGAGALCGSAGIASQDRSGAGGDTAS